MGIIQLFLEILFRDVYELQVDDFLCLFFFLDGVCCLNFKLSIRMLFFVFFFVFFSLILGVKISKGRG